MKTVFMFSGQGSQYYQMGRTLFASNPIFRKHLHELDEIVRSVAGVSVIDSLYDPAYRLSEPYLSLEQTHPAIFMTGYALVKVLQEEGIAPDYLLGCSLGEFISATVSRMLSETDALQLICKQAEIIQSTCCGGGLLAVLRNRGTYDACPEIRNNSTMAAIYSESQFVIAGEREPLNRVKNFMKQHDMLHQELMVAYGFHSPAIDGAAVAYKTCLNRQVFQLPAIPVVSAMAGKLLPQLPPHYLWEVVRNPISFVPAIELIEQVTPRDEKIMYIDLGPAGSLANLIKYIVTNNDRSKGFQVMSPFQQEVKKLDEIRQYYKDHKHRQPMPAPQKNERLLACVFPGQGSQKKGMGEDVFDRYPLLVNRASEILGYSVKELCLNDPARKLNNTEYTQPALYVVNALTYLKLKEETGLVPAAVAGHSLGEFNALFAASAMDFETGLRLVQKRGALMAEMQEGGMAAVKGLSKEQIDAIIERHGLQGLDIANYNTPNQIVLSGPRDLINRSGAHFEAAGATLYFPLNVSGAFHSRYMLPAKEAFDRFLQAFHFAPLQIPVVSNVEACFYEAGKIKLLLANQLVQPVRWMESIHFLLTRGEVIFKEVGPGDVLTKLIYSIQKDAALAVQ